MTHPEYTVQGLLQAIEECPNCVYELGDSRTWIKDRAQCLTAAAPAPDAAGDAVLECPDCDGMAGIINSTSEQMTPCLTCNGTGYVSSELPWDHPGGDLGNDPAFIRRSSPESEQSVNKSLGLNRVGYVFVPRKASDEMMEAAVDAMNRQLPDVQGKPGFKMFRAGWEAALEAALANPLQSAGE